MRISTEFLSVLLLFVSQAFSFNFEFYEDKDCKKKWPDEIETYGPDGGDDPDWPGCVNHSHSDGNTFGVKVMSTGIVDNKFAVRFYNNELCDPRDLTSMIGSSFGDDGCADLGGKTFKSFKVVCLCPEKCDDSCLK